MTNTTAANLSRLGVSYDNIRVEEIDGKMEPLVNAEGLYQMAKNAGTPEARKLVKAIDARIIEIAGNLPHLSEQARLKRAIMDVLRPNAA